MPPTEFQKSVINIVRPLALQYECGYQVWHATESYGVELHVVKLLLDTEIVRREVLTYNEESYNEQILQTKIEYLFDEFINEYNKAKVRELSK